MRVQNLETMVKEYIFVCELYYHSGTDECKISIYADSIREAYEKLRSEIETNDFYAVSFYNSPEEFEFEHPEGFIILSEKRFGLNLEWLKENGDLQIETNFNE